MNTDEVRTRRDEPEADDGRTGIAASKPVSISPTTAPSEARRDPTKRSYNLKGFWF
jgi:hypothetical protein